MQNFKRNTFIMIILTTLASGINYMCQIATGRMLNVYSFGIINSLFSIITILTVPAISLNMIASKKVAEIDSDKLSFEYTIFNINKLSLRLAVKIFFIILVTSAFIADSIGTDTAIIILTGAVITTSFLYYSMSGVIAGCKKFIYVGIMSIIIPIFKSIGILFTQNIVDEANKIKVILFSMIIGNIVATLGYFLYFKKDKIDLLKPNKDTIISEKVVNITNDMKYVTYLYFIYFVLSSLDILLINIFLGANDSGIYGAAMTFGRIMFFFTTAMVSVLVPYVASENKNNTLQKQVLKKTILFTLVFFSMLMIPINLFSDFFVFMLYGQAYANSIKYIPMASLIALIIAIINLLIGYQIGINKIKTVIKHYFIGMISIILLVYINHSSVFNILITIIIVLILLLIYELKKCFIDKK